MADPIVHLTNGIPDSGTGNITTLGQVLAVLPLALGAGGGLKIDGSGSPLPISGSVSISGTATISGTVTANAGTNLNTSALALESGGNLAQLVTTLGAVTASPAANTIGDRLKNINTTLGSPLQAGGTVNSVQSGVWTVQPGNTANSVAWKVDGSAVTQPVSGTFWQATQPVSGTFWQATQPVSGTLTTNAGSATGSAVPANAFYKGVRVATALPTGGSDGGLVGAAADKFGRQIVVPHTIRDLVGTSTTTLNSSTAETTIVPAAAAVFNDVLLILVTNTSASTNTRIDFRDTTGGSVIFSLMSIGGAPPVGFAPPVPIPQSAVNTNWTAQCATSTSDIRIFVEYAKNK